jgi:hypothetical protein
MSYDAAQRPHDDTNDTDDLHEVKNVGRLPWTMCIVFVNLRLSVRIRPSAPLQPHK